MAITAALVGSSAASAATVIGDYQFQGTRASSSPGPVLLDVGGTNSFQNDSVLGNSRQVLRFPLHSGVQMSPAGIGGSTAPYSVVTTFRFDDITGYARVLDPTPGNGSDRGIYDYNGQISIYPDGSEVLSPQVVFEPDHYATVAVTSAPPTQLKVFVNGSLVAQAAEADQTIPVVSDTLRFFKDNDTATTDEDSAGAVSCIRVFSGVLSDSEVSAIGASATCKAPAPPVQPQPVAKKKKCKKHKKKHRSAESAKKKCKKKKRR
ncbi:MAG TPA: LamG-like jellyroll fold domain-containing protein [Solirubrobacterales bacterium]